MRIIGCDLRACQQAVAMLDTETGEVVNLTVMHVFSETCGPRFQHSEINFLAGIGIRNVDTREWDVADLACSCAFAPSSRHRIGVLLRMG